MRKLIETYTQQCIACQTSKPHCSKKGVLIGALERNEPLEEIASDIFGPVDDRDYGLDSKFWLLTFVDRFTRITKIVVIENIKGETVAKALEENWVKKYGASKTLLSDQGRQYTSLHMKEMCSKHKIKQLFSTAYNPTGNGIAERINAVIGNSLRCLKGINIYEVALQIETGINNSYNRN